MVRKGWCAVAMPSGIWAAPPTIDHEGKKYHRMFDLQDPSMNPLYPAVGNFEYAEYYHFASGGGNYDAAVSPPVGWGVCDHQPRFLDGPSPTTQRNGIYWEDTAYEYRGPGTLQFMIPYEVEDVLVVYPFHECPGVNFGKGLDPFALEPPDFTTPHEFPRPLPEDLNAPGNYEDGYSWLYFGDGVGVVHDFIEIQDNWIGQDMKIVTKLGPARWYNMDRELGFHPNEFGIPGYGYPTYGSSIQYNVCDNTYYDEFMVVPMSTQVDGNFWIVQYSIYTPTGFQRVPEVFGGDGSGQDQFLRPFCYAYAPVEPTKLPGSMSMSGFTAAQGVAPALPRGG